MLYQSISSSVSDANIYKMKQYSKNTKPSQTNTSKTRNYHRRMTVFELKSEIEDIENVMMQYMYI